MSVTSASSSIVATTQHLPWVYEKDTGIRVVSGISSALSIFGSVLIILSYICFRILRTRARLILVHLAVVDMGVGLSNLVGIAANFDSFYNPPSDTEVYKPNRSIVILCETQAFIAEYCTLSSVLWTTGLAVYMYLLIINQNQKQMKLFLWFSYIFCYGIPLLVSVWLLETGRLGYSPYDSSGWCSIIVVKPFMEHETLVPRIDLISSIIGYDLWIFLTIILIVVLYVSVFSYVRLQYNELKDDTDAMVYWQAMYNIDYKFIAIPLMFIFLRIWTVILSILITYIQIPPKNIAPWALKALLYMGGMGDSGQGFINAILFAAFTQSVRKRLLSCTWCKWWKRSKKCVQENSMYSDNRLFFKTSSNPIAYESKKYGTLPKGEVVNSASENKRLSFTPVGSDQSTSVSFE